MAKKRDQDADKHAAALRALDYVADGMVVGLGTGSTAAHMVRVLGARLRAGFAVRGVPSSAATEALARDCGIPLVTLDAVTRVDLTIDGADEIDPRLRLIKGGGGALLREKIVVSVSARVVIVADGSKLVSRLGAFPLPVEVIPFAWRVVAEALAKDGGRPTLRRDAAGAPFVTDEGHYLIDCAYGAIADAEALARRLDGLVGVVEHGLFLNLADLAIVGRDGATEIIERPADRG